MKEKKPTIDVIIPTWKPGAEFADLLRMLGKQDIRPLHILIINTDEQEFDESLLRENTAAEVYHIHKEEFDHAATRNMGAGMSGADYLLFMTQDAVPADKKLISSLLAEFTDPLVKAAYARQLPKRDAKLVEGCVRSFNYPDQSYKRTIDDLAAYGIKTYFCSNTCAMYERRTFQEMGGFSAPAIFNEDTVYTARILNLGYAVAYCAEAEVFHSHNYSNMQQLKRNFDNGVSQTMHPEVFRQIHSEKEGGKMVRTVISQLVDFGRIYLVPGFLWQCCCRYLGFRLGRSYEKLPEWLIRRISMNKGFWNHIFKENSPG